MTYRVVQWSTGNIGWRAKRRLVLPQPAMPTR